MSTRVQGQGSGWYRLASERSNYLDPEQWKITNGHKVGVGRTRKGLRKSLGKRNLIPKPNPAPLNG